MKFLADEGVDRQVVERLRHSGHNVWYVAEMSPGISDDVVLDLANKEGALLLTADKDFGELVHLQRRISSGVLLLRLGGISPDSKAERVMIAVGEHGDELLQAFTVVTAGAVRIRRRKT
ncbi:MAG: DUF5615 family PIN-like protein [Nitrospirota bacterium]|nr:DUF5615 family PIN-like protein [Nitrospirota bacterium]